MQRSQTAHCRQSHGEGIQRRVTQRDGDSAGDGLKLLETLPSFDWLILVQSANYGKKPLNNGWLKLFRQHIWMQTWIRNWLSLG